MLPSTRIEIRLTPSKFYGLVSIMEGIGDGEKGVAETGRRMMEDLKKKVEKQTEELSKANQEMAQEMRRTRLQRRRRAFEDPEEENGLLRDLANRATDHTFIGVVLGILNGMQHALDSFDRILWDLQPEPLTLPRNRDMDLITLESMQQFAVLTQLNGPTITKFISAVESIDGLRNAVVDGAQQVAMVLDSYYQALLQRHTVEGVEIHHNPVTTDIAIGVYDNIDAHGEIADGREVDEISAYSIRKATILADTVKSQSAQQFIAEPDDFINLVIEHFNGMWEVADALRKGYRELINKVTRLTDDRGRRRSNRFKSRPDFDHELQLLRDLNPNSIVYKDKTGLLSAEERFVLKFRNETLRNIARMLVNTDASSAKLVEYVLKRKEELHKYFTEENSFYVCKIGSGNQFAGKAPGGLEVIPGTRPSVILDEIIGSGYDEIRDFIGQVEVSSEWNDLFVATSPSRSADKSNVLLVGPQGCGKTEAMRAVGSSGDSISIFAQGSDFMTCWAGEAQKNPKRMFEAAVKIQREGDRHVYILIDEIDQVLHTDHSSGGAHYNLTREFQILMDGVVAYPGLSVWGATNHLERIPMPMIRRFSKVLVVGELSVEDRVKLLQHFCGFMPIKGFEENTWHQYAERLDGAVGDIVRKVVDPIWRRKMREFTENKPVEARKLQDWLNRDEKFDVRNFNEGQRTEFHAMLGEHVFITPDDLDESIEDALHNLAILNEIQTAKATYVRSKSIVTDLRKLQGAKSDDQPLEQEAGDSE